MILQQEDIILNKNMYNTITFMGGELEDNSICLLDNNLILSILQTFTFFIVQYNAEWEKIRFIILCILDETE